MRTSSLRPGQSTLPRHMHGGGKLLVLYEDIAERLTAAGITYRIDLTLDWPELRVPLQGYQALYIAVRSSTTFDAWVGDTDDSRQAGPAPIPWKYQTFNIADPDFFDKIVNHVEFMVNEWHK